MPELLAGVDVAPPVGRRRVDRLTRAWPPAVMADVGAGRAPARSELLWATAANPAGGAVRLAEAAAAAVNESVDWDQRAAEQRRSTRPGRVDGRGRERARAADDAPLRQALDARRTGATRVSRGSS